MVRHGFFANDETPFTGVRALPNATTLTARRGSPVRMAGEPWPRPVRVPRSRRRRRKLLNGAAEALVQAVRPLADHGEPVRLALSGGRDSRLMAAVLHAAGVPFTARTHGFADSPDVVLATRIADALGVEHVVALTGSRERPGDFLDLLRDQVMGGPRELFEVVNEGKAKEHFAAVPTGWHNQIWHIYTLSVLLSGVWRDGMPGLPRVRIPVPS